MVVLIRPSLHLLRRICTCIHSDGQYGVFMFELDDLLLQGSERTLGAPAGDARVLGRTRPWNLWCDLKIQLCMLDTRWGSTDYLGSNACPVTSTLAPCSLYSLPIQRTQHDRTLPPCLGKLIKMGYVTLQPKGQTMKQKR